MADAQLLYYRETAQEYDSIHFSEPEHVFALEVVASLIRQLELTTILDVGCGTGRAMLQLQSRLPQVKITGVDASPDLLEIAVTKNGISATSVQVADAHDLPFEDSSFDAVVSTALLHHVETPNRVVSQMSRVAKHGVFISDSNMYGNGSLPLRLTKTLTAPIGLLRPLLWLRHGRNHWIKSDGDGLSKSYSVFDSIQILTDEWRYALVVPTHESTPAALARPKFSAPSVLVCAWNPTQQVDI